MRTRRECRINRRRDLLRPFFITLVGALFLLSATLGLSAAGDKTQPKASESHKRGICGEIRKVDLLLYENPRNHEPTTTCSYTDERLLIKPNKELPPERMKRFVFLAFLTVGHLRNDDFMLPEKVFVGYGTQCQVMSSNDTAVLQRDAKYSGDSDMVRSMMSASGAPKVACPK
jgi:hypothetical protein